MYDFPEIAEANDRLWRGVVKHARRAGLLGDLPLMQICGYPLIRSLSCAYVAVAAPRYAVPRCADATHRAVIVVASRANYVNLEDLRDTCFAMNAPDSNTGMNLPRRLIAPIARGRRFFRNVVITASHAASIEAVASGAAAAAAIDNVTFALLAEHRPQAVARVRILAATAASPTPPFVAPHATESRVKNLLYDALAAAIDDPELVDVRRTLHFTGIAPATVDTYEVLARYEEEAGALGYSVLA